MPDNRFTPGPWAIDGTSPLDSHPAIIIATQDFVIAEVFADTDPTEPEVVANATLIAAAPDLVEAATELVRWYGPFNPAKHPPEINGAWLRLVAALTKAGVQS